MGDLKPFIFKKIEPILEVFKKKEHLALLPVQELLEIYEKAKTSYTALFGLDKEIKSKKPFIVLEGLDGSGKTTVGKRLANNLDAAQWKTPPESVSHLREFFDEHPLLRTPFYSIGNYIAAYEVSNILPKQSVVMDRFWHSTCTYALAQAVADNPQNYKLPTPEDDIYDWPNDLPKPDIVLYLDVCEEVRLQRHSRRTTVTAQENLLKADVDFRRNILQAYKSMKNPGIVIIDGNPTGFKKVLSEIQAKIDHLI